MVHHGLRVTEDAAENAQETLEDLLAGGGQGQGTNKDPPPRHRRPHCLQRQPDSTGISPRSSAPCTGLKRSKPSAVGPLFPGESTSFAPDVAAVRSLASFCTSPSLA